MKFASLIKNRNLFVSILLLIIYWVTYSNSLHNNFMMNDHALIVQNTAVRDWGFLQLNLFPQLTAHRQGQHYLYYRPISHLLNMLTKLAFGNRPFGYHLINLLLFYLSGISLFELLHLLFKDWKLAFATSLLYIAHPIPWDAG